jgi:hypothetical protein
MLWQKLQREMPAMLAETIKIADSYALGDPMQPTLDSQGQGQTQGNNNNTGRPGQFYRSDNQNKRRDERPDYRYGTTQVAVVEEEQGAPTVASVRDMRAISSLSSSNSKHNPSRRRMSGSTRMPAVVPAKRSNDQNIRWVWPWTNLVCSTHSSRVSRQII